MKKFLLTLLAATGIQYNAAAQTSADAHAAVENAKKNVDVISCQVVFDYATANYNEKSLNICVDKLKAKPGLEYVELMTSATPKGSAKYNQKLTDERAAVLEKYLAANLPKTTYVETTSIGKNYHFGRSGTMNFVYVNNATVVAQNTNAAQQGNNVNKQLVSQENVDNKSAQVASSADSKVKFRGAVRAGRDIYMVSSQAAYFSLGAEAGLQVQQAPHFRYDFGLEGAQLVNDNYLSLYNFYGFAGAYYTNSGFLIGARGLVGGITNQDKHLANDEGGEVRAGYEYKNVSVVFDVGRTKDMARYGVELGMSL